MGSSSDGDETVLADASRRSPQRACRRRRGGEDTEEKPASPPKEQATRSAMPIDALSRGAAPPRGPIKKILLDLLSWALTAAILAALAATALLSSSSSSGVDVVVASTSSSSFPSPAASFFEPTFDPATGLTLPPPSIWDGGSRGFSSASSSPSPSTHKNHFNNYSSLRDEAREWFASTFDLYLEHAFPRDDLRPLSCSGADSQGGIALTRIDAMTTALMLGETERLEGTVAWASRGRGRGGRRTDDDGSGDGDGDVGGKRKIQKQNSSDSSSSSSYPLLRFDNKGGARVHVFELTIRAVGSLVSSHIYLKRGMLLKNSSSFSSSSNSSSSSSSNSSSSSVPRFPSYDGVSVLSQALDLAERLLPAFDTPTGIPLSWVNLTEEGQQPFSPQKEKDRSTCAACAGTLLLEFAALSRESGDERFERAAARAARALHSRRSPTTGLVGNTVDVDSGNFLRRDSGVGAGIDSYYEYLLKSYLLTGEKEWLTAFVEAYTSAMRHCSPPIMLMLESEEEEEGEKGKKTAKKKFTLKPRRKAWRVDSHIDTAAMTRPWISSLGAFWPGLQALAGQVADASRSHADWAAAWSRFDGLPEALDASTGAARHPTLAGYPLRPELAESSFALFAEAGGHEAYLATGAAVMRALRERCRAACGFAALADVGDGGGSSFSFPSKMTTTTKAAAASASVNAQQQDAMESFFLSETVKYLWLLFSAADGDEAEAGGAGSTARLLDGVVLTTEGHPLPPYPLLSSEAETAEEEEEEDSDSSHPVPAACSRLCSSSSSSSSSDPNLSPLAISRSLSAAMPLLSPTERDVEVLRRRRCLACRAVEEGMAPVRELWAAEMAGAERAAASAMEKAERAAAEMKRKEGKGGGGGSLSGATSSSSSSSLEHLLLQQQQQQLQEQRHLLQQLQFLQQQQQQQQRPPVAQVLCRLKEVDVVAASSQSSAAASSSSSKKKTISCGSLSLVPREQMPIKPELVPAETLVLQVAQADGETAAAAAAAALAAAEKEEGAAAVFPGEEEEMCPADGDEVDDADENSSSLPPREWRLRLRVSSSSSLIPPPLSLSGYSAEFGPSLASAAECEERSGKEEESVGSRPCSVSGLVVAAKPADACSSSSSPPLTFEPAIPQGSAAGPLIVVVERGNCDFEAKVSAVAAALPSSGGAAAAAVNASASASAAVAVVVLSGDDAHLSMGRSVFSPSLGEPPIPSMLLPRSQAEKLRSAMERAGQSWEKKEKKSGGGVPLRAELRAMPEKAEAAAATADERGVGSGGSGPPPALEVEGGGSSAAPLLPPNLGTVSISALAPPSAAAWLHEREEKSFGGGVGDDGSGGSETINSFVSGTPLQQLLASVAQSREFAALLREVAAREKEGEEGTEE